MRTLVLGVAPESSLDELYVFAGPWCFAQCPARLEHNWLFPAEPFADPDNLETAARLAKHLVALSAEHLRHVLNTHHKVNLSPAFWDTALAPWLSTAVEILVDRMWRLSELIRLHGETPLRVPLPARQGIRFTNSIDFLLRGALSPQWNHWLFARLLEGRMPSLWKPEACLPTADCTEPFMAGGYSYSHNSSHSYAHNSAMANMVRNLLSALPFPRQKGFSLSQSLRLSRALLSNTGVQPDRTLPLSAFAQNGLAQSDEAGAQHLPHAPGLPPFTVDNGQLFALLEELLPQSLQEPLPRPWFLLNAKRCPVRVAPVSAADNDRLRLKLAWHCEQGGRLVHIQHGGEYGYVRSSVAYAVAEYRHHAFISWGWDCTTPLPHDAPPLHGQLPDGSCHVTPLPHPFLESLRGQHKEQSPALLFVGTEMALVPYNLKSTRRTVQHMEYRAGKARFLSALPEALLQNVQYRPYFDMPCTLPDAPWVLERFPAITRCQGPLEPHVLSCRLLVLDHLGTTLAQALAAGTPFVLFHNPAHQPVSADAEALLTLLTDAGILYTRPAAAAAHCAAVWDNVSGWWNKPHTFKAREAFARCHAQSCAKDPLPAWVDFLTRV